MTSWRGSEAGQSTVELVATLPFVVMVVLGVAQIGLVARDRVLVAHAAAQAARAAAVEPTVAAVRSAATTGGALDGSRLDATVEPAGGLTTVRLRYSIPTDVPLVGALVGDLVASETVVVASEDGG